MGRVAEWNRQLTARSLERLGAIPELTIGIDASCRLSFYLYNTVDEVERAVDALAAIVSARRGASDSRAARGSTRNLSTQTPAA
jgi:hypothetical protein